MQHEHAVELVTETVGTHSHGPRRRLSLSLFRRRRARVGAVLAVAGLLGLLLWLTIGNSGGSSSQPANVLQPTAISSNNLRTLAGSVSNPIYWAGPMAGMTYELSRTANGRVYVRYLPSGVKVGATQPYLTIATYPVINAFAATRGAAAGRGAVSVQSGPGSVAFYVRSHPQSVFYARSGSNVQVEVFDPSALKARTLVSTGRVAPVAKRSSGTGVPSGGHLVSVNTLKQLAVSLHHPIYWLGEKPGSTYELTRTADGKLYVRYLPQGVKAGSSTPYTTVAMYPSPHALATLRPLANDKGAESYEIQGGGLALFAANYPRSVHVAFPDLDYQIEVFDPTPHRALDLVKSGDLKSIR
jgi:hypothetical protein